MLPPTPAFHLYTSYAGNAGANDGDLKLSFVKWLIGIHDISTPLRNSNQFLCKNHSPRRFRNKDVSVETMDEETQGSGATCIKYLHIVNMDRIRLFNSVNLKYGYGLIDIRSPREVTGLWKPRHKNLNLLSSCGKGVKNWVVCTVKTQKSTKSS